MSDIPEIEVACYSCEAEGNQKPRPANFLIEFTCGCREPTCTQHMTLEVAGRALFKAGHKSCGSPFVVGVEKMTLLNETDPLPGRRSIDRETGLS